jgi:hypothetical protein
MRTQHKIKLWLISIISAGLLNPSAQALTVDLGTRTSPTAFTYSNSFNAPTTDFTDWFAFAINNSTTNVLTASISLAEIYGISMLDTKLFKGYVDVNGVHDEGWLASGVSTKIDEDGAVITFNEIAPLDIPSGQYLLRIKGAVNGTFGGSYIGIANFAAVTSVPIPGVLTLLISGMAFMGVFFRRKH